MDPRTEPEARLGTVIQRPWAAGPVTPSSYVSLQALASCMRLIAPLELKAIAESAGFETFADYRREASGRKQFQVQAFRAPVTAGSHGR